MRDECPEVLGQRTRRLVVAEARLGEDVRLRASMEHHGPDGPLAARMVEKRHDSPPSPLRSRTHRRRVGDDSLEEPVVESAVEFDQQSGAIRKVDVERALSESGLGGDLRHRQSGQSGTPRNSVGRFQQLNDVVSLSAREADVAVRLAKPVGDSLVARRLPSLEMGLFASREYLAGRRPAGIDLRGERLLGFDASRRGDLHFAAPARHLAAGAAGASAAAADADSARLGRHPSRPARGAPDSRGARLDRGLVQRRHQAAVTIEVAKPCAISRRGARRAPLQR